MKHKLELDAQYAWSRKGKKYRTKYFAALELLLGDSFKDNCETKVKRSSDSEHPKG